MKHDNNYDSVGDISADKTTEATHSIATETILAIPLRLIDFGRALLAQPGCLPLAPEIEEWLDEQGIACIVSAPWREKDCIAKFANAVDAFVFKLRWL